MALYDEKLIRKQQIEKDLNNVDLAVKARVGRNAVTRARAGRDIRVSTLNKMLKPLGLTFEIVPITRKAER